MSCGEILKPLYQIDGLPTFQNRVFATPDEARACAQGDMRLVQDEATGLIRNAAFDVTKMVYDENYQNEQANSATFRRHLGAIADLVVDKLGRGPLVEVGCGKGYFLEMLAARGDRARLGAVDGSSESRCAPHRETRRNGHQYLDERRRSARR